MINSRISDEFMTNVCKLGVASIHSLLTLLPKKYNDYRNPVSSLDEHIDSDEKVYIKVKVSRKPVITRGGGGKPGSAKLAFEFGRHSLTSMVFGNPFEWQFVKEGTFICIVGKIATYNGFLQIKSPELVPETKQNRIVPEYKSIPKVITSKSIEDNIAVCLRDHMEENITYICRKIGRSKIDVEKNALKHFKSIKEMFVALHRPLSIKDVENATEDARNLNAYSSIVDAMSAGEIKPQEDSVISFGIDDIKKTLTNIPFTLTQDQKRAVWEISKDLTSPYPMDRLLSGDVGCGKTVSYAIPAALTSMAGRNAVIMMPNLLLANQVANELKSYFPDLDVELVIGGKGKTQIDLDGKHPIIVGTSAILWWYDSVKDFYDIDLLIIDEQQKLGSEQKNKLLKPKTNFLEATATAIPRTMATVLYGNKTVSYIEECPVDKTIVSRIVGKEHRKKIFNKLQSIVTSGFQIAVLYPIRKYDSSYIKLILPEFDEFDIEELKTDLKKYKAKKFKKVKPIGENEDDYYVQNELVYEFYVDSKNYESIITILSKYEDSGLLVISDAPNIEQEEAQRKNVEDAARNWEVKYPGRVVMIHGGLSVTEKIDAIDRAKSGQCDIIITSSVIEIGLTMPDLRGLLIVDADKYGASTLHQFRGRLARKGGNGEFYMMVDSTLQEAKEESMDRLNLLVKYTKGSQIAEDDMKQRGFGQLNKSGTNQKGFEKGIFIGLKFTPQDIDTFMKAA